MTVLCEDNIVDRTLLNVPDPSVEQLGACAMKNYGRLNKRQAGRCSPATEDRRRVAQRPSNILVVECLSSRMISVSWRDSCSGRYTEEIWCSSSAHVEAFALTTSYQPRDEVFRPRARETRVPINRHQMILTATVAPRVELVHAYP